eukprot:COSAG04_NODE_968_length_9110_cov_6.799911_10_plen_91_part_00
MVCEVNPQYHDNVVFNYGAITAGDGVVRPGMTAAGALGDNSDDAAIPVGGADDGNLRPQVCVRDIELDLATVKPIIPKAEAAATALRKPC